HDHGPPLSLRVSRAVQREVGLAGAETGLRLIGPPVGHSVQFSGASEKLIASGEEPRKNHTCLAVARRAPQMLPERPIGLIVTLCPDPTIDRRKIGNGTVITPVPPGVEAGQTHDEAPEESLQEPRSPLDARGWLGRLGNVRGGSDAHERSVNGNGNSTVAIVR